MKRNKWLGVALVFAVGTAVLWAAPPAQEKKTRERPKASAEAELPACPGGDCDPTTGECPSFCEGRCVPEAVECQSDADCPEGFVCEMTQQGGFCLAPAPVDEVHDGRSTEPRHPSDRHQRSGRFEGDAEAASDGGKKRVDEAMGGVEDQSPCREEGEWCGQSAVVRFHGVRLGVC